MIDFGCCHDFSASEFKYVMDVERTAIGSDEWRRIIAFGCDLTPDKMSNERFRMMQEYCEWLLEPVIQGGCFDFGRPGQFEPGIRLCGTFIRRRWTRSQPVNVWLTKLFFGTRAMLTHLKARVPYGPILKEESPL